MARFFIDRPIFAWVVAIFIIIFGAVSVTRLPIAQYPQVAPPSITLTAVYPGADAQTMEESVLAVIEKEMNGVEGLDYMESKALSNGMGTLVLTFKTGTNADFAQVDVQNRLARAQPRLPAAVKQTGVQVAKASSNFLLFSMFYSENPNMDIGDISDFVARNIQPELQRVPGVGNVQLFGSERAMRIWLDPQKLHSFNLSSADVNNAIATQNIQISGGGIGELPNDGNQSITANIIVSGQLKTADDFGNIVLRANPDGSSVRLRDVARVEIGSQSYATTARLNGKPAVGVGVQLTPDGNALETSKLIKERLEKLQPTFPSGVKWDIPYDSSSFVGISIEKVVHTLIEAIVLVFLVMYLFLQNFRYTLIPTIVVPIALLGSFAVMSVTGMSINVLTMFAMVLVIGIVVDDAIVVVENVERIMAEDRLGPVEATHKAMSQISGAVIGITLVLISVFIPMAFFQGATGNIYRQFSLVMAVSIFFSAFLALSLTPALCATLLKPVPDNHHDKAGFFGWFNRTFTHTAKRYEGWVARLLQRGGRILVIYLLLTFVAFFVLSKLPTGFLPNEDQGFAIAAVQLPPGATQERTSHTFEQLEKFTLSQPEVKSMVSVLGFGFNGQGQNVGLSFITLKDWKERTGKNSAADAVANRILGVMMQQVKDGTVFVLSPPAIPGMGANSGFNFRLEDRANQGHEALLNARNQLLGMAAQNKNLMQVRPDGMEDAPMLRLDIDRDAAAAQGLNFSSVASGLSTALGSSYVNDFPNKGRLQQVIVRADTPARMQPEDIMQLTFVNNKGQSVPLSSFGKLSWVTGPVQSVRYNGYPAMAITGMPAFGQSSGKAIAEMEKMAAKLPPGFAFEWTGQSKQEIAAGSQAYILYGFSILAVFLCLAALYESWSIPFAVLLVVPLGLLGVALGVFGRFWGNLLMGNITAYGNDVYFQVGLITVIGLSAKNAVLIVEFAKDLQAQGKNPLEAALAAAHLRFRPILMTSFAFIMGVVPLYFAGGASSASQRAIGTTVFWGMVVGTLLGVFFIPMFYAAVRSFFRHTDRQRQRFAEASLHAGITPEAADHYLADAEEVLSEDEKRRLHEEGEKYRHSPPPDRH